MEKLVKRTNRGRKADKVDVYVNDSEKKIKEWKEELEYGLICEGE